MVVVKKKLEICVNAGEFGFLCKSIFKVGLAPFGLALTPNISLVIINRFSAAIMELVSTVLPLFLKHTSCIIHFPNRLTAILIQMQIYLEELLQMLHSTLF